MREHIDFVIEFLKQQPVKGCITGSALLGEYWEGMDVDCFVYTEKQFTKLLNTLIYDDRFQLLSDQEVWKFNQWINEDSNTIRRLKIVTIKFTYNTCIPVNIIIKDNCNNIFSTLSTFDMDIICKGIDIESGQTLDLTGDSLKTRMASPNKWNPVYNKDNITIWQVSRVLRQSIRAFKYYNRGFNVTNMINNYIRILEASEKYKNLFNSDSFKEKQETIKSNGKIVIKFLKSWLDNPIKLSTNEFEELNNKLKEL